MIYYYIWHINSNEKNRWKLVWIWWKIIEINPAEIDELKNKILISSNKKDANYLNEQGKNEIIDKEELTKKIYWFNRRYPTIN